MSKKSHQTRINSGKVTEVTKGNRKGNRYLPLYIYLIDIFIYMGYLVTSLPRVHVGIYIFSREMARAKKVLVNKPYTQIYIYPTCVVCVCV
jgi:hypothetical protein